MKTIKDYIFRNFQPIAFYFQIQRPVKKISKALSLAGYSIDQADDMAVYLVWNNPSTALNAMKYAEKNLSQFCNEYGT